MLISGFLKYSPKIQYWNMSKKIVFIADFFAEHGSAGAELNNEEFILLLRDRGLEVLKVQSHLVEAEHIENNEDKIFIVSNFVNLHPDHKKTISRLTYAIYEHDHKYLKSRDPGPYSDYKAPPGQIINRDFYEKARAVFCQSLFHLKIIKQNLQVDNLVNLSGNLWSLESLNLLEEIGKLEKENSHAIVNSGHMHKNVAAAVKYCESSNMEYNIINSTSYHDFLSQLGKHKGLVFFPKTPETLSRIVVEARMMGMSTKTTKNVGAIYEEWFDKKGPDLINVMRQKRHDIPETVLEHCYG